MWSDAEDPQLEKKHCEVKMVDRYIPQCSCVTTFVHSKKKCITLLLFSYILWLADDALEPTLKPPAESGAAELSGL